MHGWAGVAGHRWAECGWEWDRGSGAGKGRAHQLRVSTEDWARPRPTRVATQCHKMPDTMPHNATQCHTMDLRARATQGVGAGGTDPVRAPACLTACRASRYIPCWWPELVAPRPPAQSLHSTVPSCNRHPALGPAMTMSCGPALPTRDRHLPTMPARPAAGIFAARSVHGAAGPGARFGQRRAAMQGSAGLGLAAARELSHPQDRRPCVPPACCILRARYRGARVGVVHELPVGRCRAGGGFPGMVPRRPSRPVRHEYASRQKKGE